MKKRCQLPPKVSLHPRGIDFFNTMPCILPEEYNRFGCKIVSRVCGQHPPLKSVLMLFDTLTGGMLAMMDADWITAMRTGAVAALAINTLRKRNNAIYAFMGLGTIGRATLDCLIDTNAEASLLIKLKRYKDYAEKIAEEYSGYGNVTFSIADTIEDFISGSDVIVSCITQASENIVPDVNLFKPGVLVVPVHTRGFQNCDTVFDKVFGDDTGHIQGFKYFRQFRKYNEIAAVLSGEVLGRENDNERILSYNVGIGLHDVLFATKIMDRLCLSWGRK